MQKELLVNTAIYDAPKTRAMKAYPDTLVPVQKYKVYHRVALQQYNAGQRPPPLTFKATIPTEWLESFLMSGCHKKSDGYKWTFEEIDDAELFRMYESRRRKVDPKRPSTFLREKKLVWATHTLCRNAADTVILDPSRISRQIRVRGPTRQGRRKCRPNRVPLQGSGGQHRAARTIVEGDFGRLADEEDV